MSEDRSTHAAEEEDAAPALSSSFHLDPQIVLDPRDQCQCYVRAADGLWQQVPDHPGLEQLRAQHGKLMAVYVVPHIGYRLGETRP